MQKKQAAINDGSYSYQNRKDSDLSEVSASF